MRITHSSRADQYTNAGQQPEKGKGRGEVRGNHGGGKEGGGRARDGGNGQGDKDDGAGVQTREQGAANTHATRPLSLAYLHEQANA